MNHEDDKLSEQTYRIKLKYHQDEIEVEGDKEFVEKHIKEFKEELRKKRKAIY